MPCQICVPVKKLWKECLLTSAIVSGTPPRCFAVCPCHSVWPLAVLPPLCVKIQTSRTVQTELTIKPHVCFCLQSAYITHCVKSEFKSVFKSECLSKSVCLSKSCFQECLLKSTIFQVHPHVACAVCPCHSVWPLSVLCLNPNI